MRSRTHKITLAISAAFTTLALHGCQDDKKEVSADAKATTEIAETTEEAAYVYTKPKGSWDFRHDPYDDKFLLDIDNIQATRDGKPLEIDITGYCDGMDQSDLDAYIENCTTYLTETVKEQVMSYNFLTASVPSSDPDFIKAGLSSKPEHHEEAVAKRLSFTTHEAIVDRVERGSDNFFFIDRVSDLELAAKTLDME